MKILGTYSIDYGRGFVQIKNLITQSDFKNIVIPKQKEIYQAQLKDDEKTQRALSKELKDLFGEEFFTDESPIWLSKKENKLILNGHEYYCEVLHHTIVENKQIKNEISKVVKKKKSKISAYKSLVTGKEYSYEEYSNRGMRGDGDYTQSRAWFVAEFGEGADRFGEYTDLSEYYNKKDLPKDEYPYTYVC